MGTLIYAGSREIAFDDRTLAHLQIAIGLKLRRQEGFFFAWEDGVDGGGGRGAVWIDHSIPLLFRYESVQAPKISREWLEELTASSNSSQGLVLADERR
ncbi:ATP-dependent DNA ligase [Leifsonia sp. NPDC058194]|uniref:DUF7882 family protein n=1 Tax=Leifsonia sp. NPDC058194 TaxID=3346374 RepID=UPI0036DCDFD7